MRYNTYGLLILVISLFNSTLCRAENSFTIDGSKIVAPTFDGYTFINDQESEYFKNFEKLKSLGNEILAIYLPSNAVKNKPDFSQYMIIMAPKGLSHQYKTLEQWLAATDVIIPNYMNTTLRGFDVDPNRRCRHMIYEDSFRRTEKESQIVIDMNVTGNEKVIHSGILGNEKVIHSRIIGSSIIYIHGVMIYFVVVKHYNHNPYFVWAKKYRNDADFICLENYENDPDVARVKSMLNTATSKFLELNSNLNVSDRKRKTSTN